MYLFMDQRVGQMIPLTEHNRIWFNTLYLTFHIMCRLCISGGCIKTQEGSFVPF